MPTGIAQHSPTARKTYRYPVVWGVAEGGGGRDQSGNGGPQPDPMAQQEAQAPGGIPWLVKSACLALVFLFGAMLLSRPPAAAIHVSPLGSGEATAVRVALTPQESERELYECGRIHGFTLMDAILTAKHDARRVRELEQEKRRGEERVEEIVVTGSVALVAFLGTAVAIAFTTRHVIRFPEKYGQDAVDVARFAASPDVIWLLALAIALWKMLDFYKAVLCYLFFIGARWGWLGLSLSTGVLAVTAAYPPTKQDATPTAPSRQGLGSSAGESRGS